MKKNSIIWSGVFLALLLATVQVRAQETKSVRGKVTAVGTDTVTVQEAGGQSMTFKVDKDTEVIAAGAGTKAREAMREGRSGAKLGETVKVGDGAEVQYKETGDGLYAVRIRSGIEATGMGMKEMEEEGDSVSGHVTAVSADSLTVKAEDKEWVFSVSKDTNVVGRGVGTLKRQLQDAGKSSSITDFVKVGDPVMVKYHQMGSTYHATEVEVRRTVS